MKKLVLLSFILCLIIFLTGCSFSIPFIVENQTNKTIIVRYLGNHKPDYVNLAKTNGEYNKWQDLPQENYSYSINEKIVTVEVKLPPNCALRLENIDARDIHNNLLSEHFSIKSLSIIGENGSIKLEGNQVFEQFQAQKLKWVLFGPDTKSYMLYYKE